MRRRVLLIALWLLVGAVVNVGVAWTRVMLPEHAPVTVFWYPRRDPLNAGVYWIVKGQESACSCTVSQQRTIVLAQPSALYQRRQIELSTTCTLEAPDFLLVNISEMESIAQQYALEIDGVTSIAVGWPIWAMQSRTLVLNGASPFSGAGLSAPNGAVAASAEFDTGLDVAGVTHALPWRSLSDVLPTRPIWPAFALNTLYYALLTWSVIRGPRTLRRWRRRRAGRCIACGYELKGLAEGAVCPECGRGESVTQ